LINTIFKEISISMNTASLCTVCVEPYSTKSPKYTCDECKYEACSRCVLRYVEGNDHEPKCMGCGKMWSRKYLFDTMSHTVYKRMIDKSTMVEVQRQKAMLASTIPLVEMWREHEAVKKQATQLELQIADLSFKMQSLRDIAENLQTNMNNFARGRPLTDVTDVTKTRLFLCRCSKSSNNEECRGFVNSETHICAVCDTKHCTRCLEELGKDHQCNEDVIQNVKALRATCKPCPI
jgi:hypothetical protein